MTAPDSRPDWDQVWMGVAVLLGQRSRCVRGSIGCVLVSPDNQVVSASYVGPPPDFEPANQDPHSSCADWCPRSQPGAELDQAYLSCVSSHAEMSAVARADFSRIHGGTAYVNGAVCLQCAKLLAASKIGRVVMQVHETDTHRRPDQTIRYLRQNHIVVIVRDGDR